MYPIYIRVENTDEVLSVMAKSTPIPGSYVRLRYNPGHEQPFLGWHAWKVLRELTSPEGNPIYIVTRATDPSEIPVVS